MQVYGATSLAMYTEAFQGVTIHWRLFTLPPPPGRGGYTYSPRYLTHLLPVNYKNMRRCRDSMSGSNRTKWS